MIKCHAKGKAGQGGCFPPQMNKIQPFLSSVPCFTWAGPMPAVGAPGADDEDEAGSGGFHCVHLC